MPTTNDVLDKLAAGYERMLERTSRLLQTAESAAPRFRELLAQTREKAVELGELTREEANRVSQYLERDVQDAAAYLNETGADFREWLRFDAEQVEQRLLDAFMSVADRTRLELEELSAAASAPQVYHTGEIVGPGTLTCSACGKTLHFRKAGHIPPCPACRKTEFLRERTG